MIVAIGGMKGGSGKTTVATNLAVMQSLAPADLLLVDADPQGTANDFTALRNESVVGGAGYTVIHLKGRAVSTEILRMVDKYDDIVIDTGGLDPVGQRAALAIADLMLVPFLPRSFDFWTLDRVIELVEEAKAVNPNLRACSFLNRADPSGRDNQEAAETLSEPSPLQFLPTPLGSRKAFSKAAARGLSVTELRPVNHKAVEEMTDLLEQVYARDFESGEEVSTDR